MGVSVDPLDKLARFQKEEEAPQRFVADVDASIVKAYGVDLTKDAQTFAKRVTFVVGHDGNVLFSVFDWSPLSNVNKTLEWLKAHPQSQS